jgi:hypothetical protein
MKALLLGVIVLLCASTAGAAGEGDDGAEKAIQQAVSVDYLATRFDKAETTLLEVSKCGEPCSPAVVARAWMYVGLVRIVGRNDAAGARAAFGEALKLDPQAQLDADLATPEASALWQEVQANPAAASEPRKPTVLGGMQCTPEVREVQTRRPIPVACTTDQPATRAEIKYREFGSTQWHTLQMGSAGGKWLGTIPCSATDLQGKLSWYVNALDQGGELIDNYGAQRQPIEMQLVENTTEAPPAYPDQEPPTRCGAASECPPEMLGTPACPGTVKPDPSRGNKAAGDHCESTPQCDTGLDCLEGRCQLPKSCETDIDCEHGRCVDLLCTVDEDDNAGPSVMNWIGLHFAADFAQVTGDDVCQKSQYACFYNDGTRLGANGATLTPGFGGNVASGFALGTGRVLASYERLLTPNIGVEARLGFAFGGAPSATGVSFLPIHAEARGKYWLLGPPIQRVVSPYLHLGGGLGQVDAKVDVVVGQDCSTATGPCSISPLVEAYQQMGVGFVTLGGGALFALGPNYGINLNINGQYLFPKSGLVLQPALGFEYGF